jgi:hypothetical protein
MASAAKVRVGGEVSGSTGAAEKWFQALPVLFLFAYHSSGITA